MRPKSMILILIALGCGLVASVGISKVMEDRGSGSVSETVQIYVAMTDIPLGEPLTQQTLKLEEWPKDKIPEGAIMNAEEVEGRRPRQPLFAGEPILQGKLIDGELGVGGALERIPRGYRALPVKVNMESGGSGLIHPGDHVDVLLFMTASGSVAETSVKTILKDIRVFAVNEQVDRQTDRDGSAILAKTVSLLVKPDQVEELMLATMVGRLSLSLRRADDDSAADTDGAVVADLDGARDDEDAEDTGPAIESDGGSNDSADETQSGGLVDLLDSLRAPTANPADNFGSHPDVVMDIHTPEGIKRFSWDPEATDQLPRELDPSSAGGFDQGESGWSDGLDDDFDDNGGDGDDGLLDDVGGTDDN